MRERLLKKGFPEDTVSGTLEYLKQTGLIDDAALAANLKRLALDQRHLGYGAARQFMQKRGLPRELIGQTLGYDEETELANARKLLDKKCRTMGNYLTKKDKKRLYDFLARRGYLPVVIGKVLGDLKFRGGEGE
jgi:SOS response regulatory protein OraA/RecX